MKSINLSSIDHTMSSIIMNNHQVLDSCQSKNELLETLKQLFNDNNLDTTASRRLIQNVSKQKSFVSALQVIYNSFLCGSGMAVI